LRQSPRISSPPVVDGCDQRLACFLLFLEAIVTTSRYPGAQADVSGRAPERRIHHRVLVGAAAWLIVDDTRHSAECVNVSMGGAAVRTLAHVSTGSMVSFELSLGDDHRSVTIQCEVVRASQTELGLRFLALNRASLEAIVSLL
jgi:hypothetical protein